MACYLRPPQVPSNVYVAGRRATVASASDPSCAGSDDDRDEKTAVPAEKFDLEDYAGTYKETRDAYLKDANELKDATGPYKAARDANVASTASATYTKSLYE